MANTLQAKKRVRQAEKRRRSNISTHSAVRTCIKKVIKAIAAGNRVEAEAAYVAVVPMLDRIAGKGIIHKNKAARHKSRLLLAIRKIAVAA